MSAIEKLANSYGGLGHHHPHLYNPETYAAAMKELKELQAAQELAETRGKTIKEFWDGYKLIMSEECTSGGKHCECVPRLKARIKELEEMLKASEKNG